MAEIKVLDSTKLPALADDRKGKSDRLVFYEVDGKQRRFVRVPDETFSEPRLLEAIRKDLADHGALKGKTFTV